MFHFSFPKNTLTRGGLIMLSVFTLLLVPLYLIHAQSLTFTTDPGGNWQYSSGYSGDVFTTFVTADGRGSLGQEPADNDTSVPATVPIEVFVANTPTFANPCSSSNYTGDPATDFACLITAAKDQGYSYTLGQAPQAALPPVPPAPVAPVAPAAPTALKPCGCP